MGMMAVAEVAEVRTLAPALMVMWPDLNYYSGIIPLGRVYPRLVLQHHWSSYLQGPQAPGVPGQLLSIHLP